MNIFDKLDEAEDKQEEAKEIGIIATVEKHLLAETRITLKWKTRGDYLRDGGSEDWDEYDFSKEKEDVIIPFFLAIFDNMPVGEHTEYFGGEYTGAVIMEALSDYKEGLCENHEWAGEGDRHFSSYWFEFENNMLSWKKLNEKIDTFKKTHLVEGAYADGRPMAATGAFLVSELEKAVEELKQSDRSEWKPFKGTSMKLSW